MAVEFGPYNIQVNAIAPGYFETEMTQSLVDDPQFNKKICDRTPMNRWGKQEELIGAAIFLSTEASSFVNGQIIHVDGGILCRGSNIDSLANITIILDSAAIGGSLSYFEYSPVITIDHWEEEY